jgi:hypothetical protein
MLAKEGKRVGADFEDWYSRDLLPEAQRSRPIHLLEKVERFLLHNAVYVSTTSHAMAGAMQKVFGGRLPEVVYNVFPWADRETIDKLTFDRLDPTKPSLYWFSKVIGPGRGLELLFEALALVSVPVELHLRGDHNPKMATDLYGKFPVAQGHQLFLHQPLAASQLLSRISEHDIGLALELSQLESRDLTVTYKFFHYLVGGLAVIATNTGGQAEIAASIPGAVLLASQANIHDLAGQIADLVSNRDRLLAAKAAAITAAKTRFCWEREAPVVVESIERALTCKFVHFR